ncbi:MAG: serine hydrolase domain-containing protein, partial [Candidatus Binatia bacterium]
WKPFYEEIIKGEKNGKINFVASRAAKSYVLEQIHREKPLGPPGAQAVYSDLGFMVLGEIVETMTSSKLDRFCQDRIFKPLGLQSTAFIDLTQLRTRRIQPVQDMIAPTENCPWRKKILCGEVHDDNAYAVGGVVGHAGLFSSARDIHAIIARLNQCLLGKDSFLPPKLVQEFLRKDQAIAGSTHALGWDTPTPNKSASGSHFSSTSVGHLGFTGTSIWWDLEKNCHIVLLSNRVHPTRKNEKIREFRPIIHDLIMQTIKS